MKRGIRVFTLPGDEMQVNNILNNPNISVIDKEKIPCPKEGVILLYLEYEDYGEEAIL